MLCVYIYIKFIIDQGRVEGTQFRKGARCRKKFPLTSSMPQNLPGEGEWGRLEDVREAAAPAMEKADGGRAG